MKRDDPMDGPNLLSPSGAATMIGRDKNEVQIRIVCGSEDEARAIIQGFAAEIREKGEAIMVFKGDLADTGLQ